MTPTELFSDLSKMVAPYASVDLTGLAGAWGTGYKRGGSKMRSKLNNERELKRFEGKFGRVCKSNELLDASVSWNRG